MGHLQLPQSLRSLTLSCYSGNYAKGSILEPESVANNGEIYAELRSLHLDSKEWSLANLSLFTNLIYLGVRLESYFIPQSPAHVAALERELITALDSMPHLRVLIVGGREHTNMIQALPEKCPQLQHLVITESSDADAMASLAQMGQLVSLGVRAGPMVNENPKDWRWLEAIAERGRLEYLHVEGVGLPVELAFTVISQCQVGGSLESTVSNRLISSSHFRTFEQSANWLRHRRSHLPRRWSLLLPMVEMTTTPVTTARRKR